MKKTLLPQNHVLVCTTFLFILCTLVSVFPVQIAEADAAPPPDPTVGGVSPYRPQKTNVQMMSETVLIDVPTSPSNLLEKPKQIKVNANFTMKNQGHSEEKMQVIFPLSRLGHDGSSEQALYKVVMSSFAVKVNGQPVSITELTTPPEESGYEVPEVLWAAFEVSFPVNQKVLLEVKYEMVNIASMYEGFTGISYILETGAGWYGNILSADITLRLPYSVTEEAIQWANPGYVISGREMQWKLKDFEPTREDNLEVGVIHVDFWQAILEQRAKIKVNPNNADAWATLGDLYERQAIFIMELHVSVINSHFMQLAIEARQKAVDLRPKWGDAHFKLAEILWYSNPETQRGFLLGGGNPSPPDLSRDDPAVQKILFEYQQSEIYGTTDNHIANTFYQQLNRTFPELKPTLSATATVPTLAPTETFVPTATDTPSPTASPTFTLMPIVTSTPVEAELHSSSNNNVLLIAGLGLIVIGGVVIYLVKSK